METIKLNLLLSVQVTTSTNRLWGENWYKMHSFTVMNPSARIKLSEFDEALFMSREPITDYVIVVDKKGGFAYCDFYNCSFEMTEVGQLHFEDVSLANCKFIGIDNYERYGTKYGELSFNNCGQLKEIHLTGHFRLINIVCPQIEDFYDNSYAHSYVSKNSSYEKGRIEGKCRYLVYEGVHFTNSGNNHFWQILRGLDFVDSLKSFKSVCKVKWDKEITYNSDCKKVVFSNYAVNPFYFATKCRDEYKEIDLSHAILIDDWTRLRKHYTGLSLIIVALLTIAFFMPIVVKYLMLVSFSHAMQADTVSRVGDIVDLKYQTVPFYKVLFFDGNVGFRGWIHFTLTSLLVLYNLVRIYLTIEVSRLRDEEKYLSDVNFPIVSIHPNKYKKYVKLTKMLRFFFLIVLAYTIVKLNTLMQIPVVDFNSFSIGS